MTTQVLMSVNNTLSKSLEPNLSVIEGSAANAKSESSSASTRKLPYQATHQVELLHIEAELEALLQQIRTLKQQRQAVDLTEAAIESPVLVS